MADTVGHNGAYYAPPTLRQRLWRGLGFHWAHAPRADADEEAEGWAPSWFMVETHVYLDWKDRLRVLFSGRLHVQQAVKTDKQIERSRSTSDVGVLPPRTKMGAR